MLKYILLTLLIGFTCFFSNVNAQDPMSLYYLENVPQSALINPAKAPRVQAYIGVPMINTIYTSVKTDLLGPDLIQSYNGGFVTLTQAGYDYEPLYKRIGKAANFSVNESITPIALGFRTKNGFFTFSWSEKASESLAIAKDMFKIMDKGLPDGSDLDFSAMGIKASYYREFSFGYSFEIQKNLRGGMHIKLLQGLAAVNTNIETFSLKTSKDLWELQMKGSINISAPIEITTTEDGMPEDFNIDTDTQTLINKGVFNFSNPGIGLDFGAVYDLNESWSFSASVNDIGMIIWTGDLNSFHANGGYSFDGLEINSDNLDSLSNSMDDLVDSLQNTLSFRHSHEGFHTSLGPKIYVGAEYSLNHYLSFGLLSRTTLKENDFQQEINVSTNLNLHRVLSTTLNFTFASNGANTIGLGLALRPGPFQFYIASDYLPNSYRNYTFEFTSEDVNGNTAIDRTTFVGPNKLDNFNLIFGINIVIGSNKGRDEPMISTETGF